VSYVGLQGMLYGIGTIRLTCVVFFKGISFIAASVNRDGVGAPFVIKVPKEFPVAMSQAG
jgi:hypothetical protein